MGIHPKLKSYYDSRKKLAIIVCVILWLILDSVFLYVKQNCLAASSLNSYPHVEFIVSILLDVIGPPALAGYAYSRGIKYLNEKGWKRKFPEYDLNGRWEDITVYTQQFEVSTALKGHKNQYSEAERMQGVSDHNGRRTVEDLVSFEQTCKTVRVVAAPGEYFTWNSLLADWEDERTLRIFYEVRYKASLVDEGFSHERRGFERMVIDESSYDKDGRPCMMKGHFSHCVCDDGFPMYLGDVTYSRRPEGSDPQDKN